MNCPNCGTSNLDNASVCVNCGRSLSQPPPAQTYTPPPPPPSDFTGGQQSYGGQPPYAGPPPGAPPSNTSVIVYLILSILMLLCCCNPLALVPLIFAIISLSRRNANDYAGAELPEARVLRRWGGQAVALPYVEGRSTTNLVRDAAATKPLEERS